MGRSADLPRSAGQFDGSDRPVTVQIVLPEALDGVGQLATADPPVVIRVDDHDKKVYVDRTKDEIKNAPQYDAERGHQDRDYRDRLGEYYGARSAR